MQQKTIAIYYEHPDWFRPLFAELDRREIPHVRLDAADHRFDPHERTGLRATLNLGHTLAHALEIAFDHELTHGEAVHVLEFQRSYQAAAKMMGVVDELTQTVIGLIR